MVPHAPLTAVVFVNRYYAPDVSATSQMLAGIAPALVASGYAVTVVTSRQRYDDASSALPATERRSGVDVVRVWSTRFGRQNLMGRAIDYLTFYLTTFVALLRLLRPGYVVVAKTDPPLVSLVCWPAAWLRGAKLVNWLQDVFPEVAVELGAARLPRWGVGLLQRARDASCRAARANVVLGPRMLSFFAQRGLPPQRFEIIPNWADDALIVPTPAGRSRLRAQLGWQDRFVVAYCGNLGRAHDHETLLGAAQLLATDTRIAFLMVGGGAEMAQLEREARARGLTAFRFLPYRPESELSDTLAAADVHLACLKPQLEGLIVPSKLYGILAAGRPTVFWGDPSGDVATELARIPAGLAVGSGDASGLADALRALQAEPARRATLGAQARQAFEARYTRGQSAAAWCRLLEAVADAPGPAPAAVGSSAD